MGARFRRVLEHCTERIEAAAVVIGVARPSKEVWVDYGVVAGWVDTVVVVVLVDGRADRLNILRGRSNARFLDHVAADEDRAEREDGDDGDDDHHLGQRQAARTPLARWDDDRRWAEGVEHRVVSFSGSGEMRGWPILVA